MEEENIEIPSLEELKEMIEEEAPFIAKKPYSIHIVNMALIIMGNAYGNEETSKVVKEFGLDDKGWRVFVDRTEDSPISKEEQNRFNALCLKDFREMN